jgi:hypothetical protein
MIGFGGCNESLQDDDRKDRGWGHLAQHSIVVEPGKGGDVLTRDARCVLGQNERIGVGWVGYHDHLQPAHPDDPYP